MAPLIGTVYRVTYGTSDACLGEANMDEHVIRAGFARLDADADAEISTAEFADAIAQMVLSQDPADPGAAVMGHS